MANQMSNIGSILLLDEIEVLIYNTKRQAYMQYSDLKCFN